MLGYQPHDYQRFATNWLVEKPAAGLFLQPGLGKTSITLSAIEELMHDRFEVRRVLVIAPLRVAQVVWEEEVEKWRSDLVVSKVLGSEKQRLAALAADADVYVINRENVAWLVEHCGRNWPFDMVVIDESSSFKNNQSARFRALRKVRPLCRRVVLLTGTPAPNTYMDLWPQLYLVDQGERIEKTIGAYRLRYFQPDKRNGTVVFSYKPLPGAPEVIQRKIGDVCMSLSAADHLKMPERTDNFIRVPLSGTAQALYNQLETDLLLPYAGSEVTAATAATLSGKLLQMANGAVYDDGGLILEVHEAKLDALEELVDAQVGQPMLVFFWYRHDLTRLRQRFPQAVELKGEEEIRKWNRGELSLLLVHPASAGHGLNLQQGGSTACWFGLTWSLELYEQANARLYRQGQKNAVVIHHLVAEKTIDEHAVQVLRGKGEQQSGLLEAVKARILHIGVDNS